MHGLWLQLISLKGKIATTRKLESPRHYSAGLSPPPPTMRLYAKADTRFSLTAAWSRWSFGTLTKCWRNAFSKWTVLLLPRSVGATDYLAMQINGPPPSTFPTAGFNQESQPPPVRAHGGSGPTAARSLRRAASPGRLRDRKACSLHTARFQQIQTAPHPELNHISHLAQPTYAVHAVVATSASDA